LQLLRTLDAERERLASVGGTSAALEQADRVRVDAEQATAQAIHARLADVSASLRDLLEQAGAAVASAFTFGLSRCDRVVAAVMAQIGNQGLTQE